MKLPRFRRRPTPEATPPPEVTEPEPGPAEAVAASPAAAPDLYVTAYSRTGLPDEQCSAQTAILRRVLSYDGDTRSWYRSLPLDHPEQGADVLTALFEATRVHGTTVRIQAHATENSPSEQLP
jgi:hypothetical protein